MYCRLGQPENHSLQRAFPLVAKAESEPNDRGLARGEWGERPPHLSERLHAETGGQEELPLESD